MQPLECVFKQQYNRGNTDENLFKTNFELISINSSNWCRGMQLVLIGGLDPANEKPLDDVWIIDAAREIVVICLVCLSIFLSNT